ncbi:MAG: hypothetical protein AB8G17_18900 [Gammaproteobacteria bacterium]
MATTTVNNVRQMALIWLTLSAAALFSTSCREPQRVQVVDAPQTSAMDASLLLSAGQIVLIDGVVQANHRGCLMSSRCYLMVERDGLWFRVYYGDESCAYDGTASALTLQSNDEVRINAFVANQRELSVCADIGLFVRRI